MPHRWDIFCTIIDNFGDIGVCWRLARQLTHEHHQRVRLWVDDLARFTCIAPDVNPNIPHQIVQNVEICLWQQVFAATEPAEVVIEAFACELPDIYVTALLQKMKQPVWINLEYLSAEPWVTQCHGLPSPHPRLPLTKTFFFPGFVQGTGGLLREKDLMAQRNAFNSEAEHVFLQSKGLLGRRSGEIRISLFCYDSAPVEKLIRIFLESSTPILLIVPQGPVVKGITALFNPMSLQTEKLFKQSQLTVQIIPLMQQTDYDRLLWSCDINFVRGEDSFVRAQWAMHPFIWNAYPQLEGAHWKKLAAFLDLYTTNMPPGMATAVRAMWDCWNGKCEMNGAIWVNFLRFNQSVKQHNRNWAEQLLNQDDLATNLVQFAGNRL